MNRYLGDQIKKNEMGGAHGRKADKSFRWISMKERIQLKGCKVGVHY